MDKEKFVQRVEGMIYHTCGCNSLEAVEVAEEVLKRAKAKKKNDERLGRLDKWKKMMKKAGKL